MLAPARARRPRWAGRPEAAHEWAPLKLPNLIRDAARATAHAGQGALAAACVDLGSFCNGNGDSSQR